MRKLRCLFLITGLFSLCSSGCWVWQEQRATESLQGKRDNTPARPWAEVARAGVPEARQYSEPEQVGTITAKALPEVSGITPSRTAAGVWWVHNDSGDQARLYAITTSGKLLGTFEVAGAQNRDWEDIASGPGRDGSPALYIADTGDNNLSRDDLVVYRVKEPNLSQGVADRATEPAEAFPFRYPDGRHDAEALIADPKSGHIYIVTKTRTTPCGVYRFPMPLRSGQQVVLEKVKGTATSEISQMRLITGAATSPDGSRVVIRTYFAAIELRRAAGRPFEDVFNAEPLLVKMPVERQGEAIAYSPDGKSLVTTSEKLPAPIYRMTCKGQ